MASPRTSARTRRNFRTISTALLALASLVIVQVHPCRYRACQPPGWRTIGSFGGHASAVSGLDDAQGMHGISRDVSWAAERQPGGRFRAEIDQHGAASRAVARLHVVENVADHP